MSIITTGINIVATGVSRSINQVQRFGQAINQTHQQAQQFANGYNRSSQQTMRHSSSLSRALQQDWKRSYQVIRQNTKNSAKALQQLENAYDRTFREIGNKYQSMVMGSVALSMSGVGIMNAGRASLGVTKVALDQARDFETVMTQIQFYGKRTADEMEKIKADIFQMGYDLPVKTSEIANSVLSAQKLGYDNVKEATEMAKEASKIQFMSLGKMDGEESLKYISHMRKMLGYTVEDTDKLTDKLTKTADISAASIDTIWKTIQSSRTAFDAIGADEDTFLTLAGVMSDRLTAKNAGMALNSFGRGIQMAEKAAREDRGSRGAYYNELVGAMGGKNLDGFGGDMLAYVDAVAQKSKEIWGTGSERKGNLISVFGQSAMDLFYAVDAYAGSTGRSMVEMREEIRKSDGHAQKLMDTLMNGSYGTEKRLEAVKEQFAILFGTAIRPAFNAILDAITKVIMGINKFVEAHPKLAKVLGYGFGLAGLLLTATGAAMLFVGGMLAIYASLNNIIIQLARNTRVLNLLSKGYSSAGQMIKAQMLGPLRLLGIALLKITGVTFFMYLAWKNDFLRMRTTFEEWKDAIGRGLKSSSAMFKAYTEGSVSSLNEAFIRNGNQKGLDTWVANGLTKARMLWDGVKDIWKDGTISPQKHQMLSDAGLIGIVEKVYEIKTAAQDFWTGFQRGLGDGLELLKDILDPLIKVWDWVSEKVLKLLQHFGYFENVNDGISKKWEAWGQKLGVMVGMVIAIRVGLWAWVKAIKMVITPFTLLGKSLRGIWNLLSKIKNIKLGNIASGIGRMLLPQAVRRGLNTANYARQRRTYARQGAHSVLPYARPVIDPTTGRPTGQATYQRRWWQRNNRGGTVLPDRNGSNSTMRSRGLMGRARDMWMGQAYVPERRVDSRGRTYHQIRTRGGGVMRSTADGLVNGRQVRTGGIRGGIGRVGSFIGRYVGNERGAVGRAGGATRAVGGAARAGGGIMRMLTGAVKGVGKLGGTVGKGLVKGLGGVVTKGIPLIFKGALRAIPILGWALLAWDAIRLVFTNWDAIKSGASKAWTWIKTEGVRLVGEAWTWIKTKAVEAWNWIKTDGVRLLGEAWTWIINKAGQAWTWIKTKASEAWNWAKTTAINLLLQAFTWIMNKASQAWSWVKTTASTKFTEIKTAIITKISEAWSNIKTSAATTWANIKSGVATALSNMFEPIKTAWNNAKSYVSNNPIVQKIQKVTETVKSGVSSAWDKTKKAFGFRTGLWKVPKDNYPAMLHNGEMVLTQKEAQILRSMVGNDANSVAQVLLGKNKGEDGQGGGTVSKSSKLARVQAKMVAPQPQQQSQPSGGDTNYNFNEGAFKVEVKNATASEMKKGAKQMFEEFKRMVELNNMKQYRPARPQRG